MSTPLIFVSIVGKTHEEHQSYDLPTMPREKRREVAALMLDGTGYSPERILTTEQELQERIAQLQMQLHQLRNPRPKTVYRGEAA